MGQCRGARECREAGAPRALVDVYESSRIYPEYVVYYRLDTEEEEQAARQALRDRVATAKAKMQSLAKAIRDHASIPEVDSGLTDLATLDLLSNLEKLRTERATMESMQQAAEARIYDFAPDILRLP